MSRIRGLGVQEFANEVSKELGCDSYTKFILKDDISGRVFLAQGKKGDELINDFTDLDSGLAITRGHKILLQELRDSWLASEASIEGSCIVRDKAADVQRSVHLDSNHRSAARKSMAEPESSQQFDVSREGNSIQGRLQSRIAPSSPMTSTKLFKTLWHSKKFTTIVGKHGVRRLQSFHARVVSRAAADLGLTDYMPNEAKAKEIPSEEELTRLRSINLKKNQKDLEWRDKIFESILEDDEHGGEVVGLNGTVYKWPKACFNSTFTAIIDDLKKKLLHAERYRKSQAKKLERYHERKPKKKQAQAGKDSAPAMQEQPHHSNEREPSKEQACKDSDLNQQGAVNQQPSRADENDPLEELSGAKSSEESRSGRLSSSDDRPGKASETSPPSFGHHSLADERPTKTAAPSTSGPITAPPATASGTDKTTPNLKTSCSLEGCSSTERPSSFCQACLEPVHRECVHTLLKELYGVEKYDGELLYCANHHSNFGFRQGLGGKCALPACAMAGKPAQHRCDVCKDPVHNLCFQGFLHEAYGVEGYDQGRFACKEHAGALGIQKAPGHHRSSSQTQASADLFAQTLIVGAAQPAAAPIAVGSGSALSPPPGSDVSVAGKGLEEREKAGEETEKSDQTKKGSRKRKGSQDDQEKKKKKRGAEGPSPGNEEPNEPDQPEAPKPPTDQPVEETQAVRQSNRAPKVNRKIHNDSFVVTSKPAAAGTDSRQKSRELEQSKTGAKKKQKSPPPEESEESLPLSGSAIESSGEDSEDSDAEATSDLPIGGAFEDKDEKMHKSMVESYQLIAMTALDINASYKLTTKALRKGIARLKLPDISKSPKLTEFSQNYLLKLLAEGLIKKKKVVIKSRKWREDGTVLDPSDIRVRF